MAEDIITRHINGFYYLCFSVFIILILFVYIKKREEEPFNTALRVFIGAGIVLTIMELGGLIAGIRRYTVGGVVDPPIAFLLAILHGMGEGGAAGSVIFLMSDGLYFKKYKQFGLGLLSLAALMLIFVLLSGIPIN